MINLDAKQFRLALLTALGVAVFSFFMVAIFGLSILSGKSHEMVDLKLQSQTADSQLANLEQSKKQVEKYAYFKNIAKTVIPSDKDQAAAVVEINQMANDAGIAIQSITFPSSNLGASSSTASQDATASGASTKAISQAKPVSGIPGLYSLELTITPETGNQVPPDRQITYPKMLDFLSRIENNRHTAQITNVNIQPASNNQSLSFTLTINIFIKP